MRTIKLKLLTQSKLEVVETSAMTFGEFKNEVANLNIDWTSTKLIDRATKASFELDDAVLPPVDCIMFVMPTKSKAGWLSYKEAKAKVKEFKDNGGIVPFNYTQATTEELNNFLDKLPVKETITSITLTPGKYLVTVEGGSTSDVVEIITLKDLNEEMTVLNSQL